MNKQLHEMTNDELGELFPIIISEPDPNWITRFHEEESVIRKVLGKQNIIRIEHIGSTSIPDLKAKPTIDILLEVPSDVNKDYLIQRMISIGYHYLPKPENPEPNMMFVKGYTIEGFKGQAYHVHVRYNGDWDELYFRDYLRTHPDFACEYGELKVKLSKKYRNDREGYTNCKTDFIKRVTQIARNENAK